jgi:hypothetical protein
LRRRLFITPSPNGRFVERRLFGTPDAPARVRRSKEWRRGPSVEQLPQLEREQLSEARRTIADARSSLSQQRAAATVVAYILRDH